MISNSINPAGTCTSTLSPSFLPIKALAIGVVIDNLPALKSASLSDTKV